MDKYIITNGEFYLNKRLRVITKKDKAIKFNSVDAAKNALKSLPIESKKFNWDIKKADESVCNSAAPANTNGNEEESFFDKLNNTLDKDKDVLGENKFDHIFVDIDELEQDILALSRKLTSIKSNREYLNQELSNVDMAICDILHYIEFNNFNACIGYKLCKVLKILRLYRRQIKNEFDVISIFETQTCENLAKGKTYEALVGIFNRKYNPRVFTELFDSNNNISNVLNDVINGVKNYTLNKETN